MKCTLLALALIISLSCSGQTKMPELIDGNAFNAELDGVKIGLFNLQNENGLVVQITNYGGRVVSLWVPDKYGNFEDIVFGYESLDRYLNSSQNYFGAIVGRCVNRIANGKFTLNDTCLLYTSPSPRDKRQSRMPSSA